MTLSIVAICVVFSCLLILYFIYSILGKVCSKDLPIPRKSAGATRPETISNPEPEEPKPDTQSDIKHDLESGIITIVPHTNWTHQFSSVAQTAPPAGFDNDGSAGGSLSPDGFRSLRSLHSSQPVGWVPPSDVSEGGHAHRSRLPLDGTATGAAGGTASQRPGTAFGNCATLGIIRGRGPSGGVGEADISQGSAGPLTNRKIIYAPLPGMIIGMKVGRGQAVKRGDRIAVLEAMKMENDILAPVDGTITNVFVFKGDSVLEGAKIAEIE